MDNNISESIATVIVILVLIVGSTIKMQNYDEQVVALGKITPIVRISSEERNDLDKALCQYSLGKTKKIDTWVKCIQNTGRRGALPTLPEDYRNTNIIWVMHKPILIDP